MSHIRTVPSPDADASRVPSGRKSRLAGAERAGASAVVGRTSSFSLTDSGREFGALLLAKNRAGKPIALPMGDLTPRYHVERCERHLSWGVHLLKRFTQELGNQEMILAAFEEQAWDFEIDDPLTGGGKITPKRRLHQTIRDLNRWQHLYFIHFKAIGRGTAVILLAASFDTNPMRKRGLNLFPRLRVGLVCNRHSLPRSVEFRRNAGQSC